MIYTWIIALVCLATHVNLFAFVVESLGTLRVGCLGQEPLDYMGSFGHQLLITGIVSLIPEFRIKMLSLGRGFREKGKLAIGWIKEKAEFVRSRYWKLVQERIGADLSDMESHPFMAFPNLLAFADKVKIGLTAWKLNLTGKRRMRFVPIGNETLSWVEIPCGGGLFTFKYPKGYSGERLLTPLLVQRMQGETSPFAFILRILADMEEDAEFVERWNATMDCVDFDDPMRFFKDVIHMNNVEFIGVTTVQGHKIPVFQANYREITGINLTLQSKEKWANPEVVTWFIESWGSRTPSLASEEFQDVLDCCKVDKLRSSKRELVRRLAEEAAKAQAETDAIESHIQDAPINATMDEVSRMS